MENSTAAANVAIASPPPPRATGGAPAAGAGATGKRFRAVVRRTYQKPRIATGVSRATEVVVVERSGPKRQCEVWAVITSINPPTATITALAALSELCVVVVGDLKSPASDEYMRAFDARAQRRLVYLSPSDQRQLGYRILDHLPWNHFGRKNVGFLYAIDHGARYVYDTDDDNELLAGGAGAGRLLRWVQQLRRSYCLRHECHTRTQHRHRQPRPEGPSGQRLQDDGRRLQGRFVPPPHGAQPQLRPSGAGGNEARRPPRVNGNHADAMPNAGGNRMVGGRHQAAPPPPPPVPSPPSPPPPPPSTVEWRTCAPIFNPYPTFAPTRFLWPRGQPLESIHDCVTVTEDGAERHVSLADVGVVQSLANHDPDVDAIFRLSHNHLPIDFDSGAASAAESNPTGGVLPLSRALPIGTLAPFNAQATLWTASAFWAMLLPVSVHGRVSDIWRSYAAQRLMWLCGQQVVFSAPWVAQFRNVHDYLADYEAERPLYSQAGELVRYLRAWRPPGAASTLPECIEALYIDLFEVGIIEEGDVELVQRWLEDLAGRGYAFPPLARTNARTNALPAEANEAHESTASVPAWLAAAELLPATTHELPASEREPARLLGHIVRTRSEHRAVDPHDTSQWLFTGETGPRVQRSERPTSDVTTAVQQAMRRGWQTDGALMAEVVASSGAPAGTPLVALMVRTFHKKAGEIMQTLPCYYAMVPASVGEVVIVLDASPGDASLRRDLLAHARDHGVTNVRVVLEPEPALASHREIFVGNLEGHAGKDRSQWSNFWFDNYTSAPVIAYSDAEVCLHLPIVPPLFLTGVADAVRNGSSARTGGGGARLRNTLHMSGDAWAGVDEWALGHGAYADAMFTSRFPIYFWRDDLRRVRAHFAARFRHSVASAGSEAGAFNEAFADITNAPRMLGPYQRGAVKHWGYSQFNLLINWAFHDSKAARRYLFHTPTPRAARVPAAAQAFGSNATTSSPWLAGAFNHGPGHADGLLACCVMFGQRAHGACADIESLADDSSGGDGGASPVMRELASYLQVQQLNTGCPKDDRCADKMRLCPKGKPTGPECPLVSTNNTWPPEAFLFASGPSKVVPHLWSAGRRDGRRTAVGTAVDALLRISGFVQNALVGKEAVTPMLQSCRGTRPSGWRWSRPPPLAARAMPTSATLPG